MIIDAIENIELYTNQVSSLQEIPMKEILEKAKTAEPGKYTINNSDIFYYIFDYEPINVLSGKGERHAKTIDLHCLMRGVEYLGICDLNSAVCEEYHEEDDYCLATGDFKKFLLDEGSFALIFPHEAHMNGIPCTVSKPSINRRIVFKIPDTKF